jgi:hypothetical protein
MPTYSKHSKRPRQKPQASKDKRPKTSQMAMNRECTPVKFEANEIAREPFNPNDSNADNKKALDSYQKTLAPISQSNRTFKP